jgi:hypothetical protein
MMPFDTPAKRAISAMLRPPSDLIDRLQSGFDQLLAADGLHTDLGHLVISSGLRADDGRLTRRSQSILF